MENYNPLGLSVPPMSLRKLRFRGYVPGDIEKLATDVLVDPVYLSSHENFGYLEDACRSDGFSLSLGEYDCTLTFDEFRTEKIRDVVQGADTIIVLTTTSFTTSAADFRVWHVDRSKL